MDDINVDSELDFVQKNRNRDNCKTWFIKKQHSRQDPTQHVTNRRRVRRYVIYGHRGRMGVTLLGFTEVRDGFQETSPF